MKSHKAKPLSRFSGWLEQLEAIHIRYYQGCRSGKQENRYDAPGSSRVRHDRDK